jgi:hypothetical protein
MPMFNINYKKNKLDNQYLLYLWYCGLDYVNETRITKLHKKWYFDHFDYKSYKTCEVYLLGEMTRIPFTGKSERYKELLGLIHTDIYDQWQFMSYVNILILLHLLMTVLDIIMCI